jgi:Glycosyl hydrolases family 43
MTDALRNASPDVAPVQARAGGRATPSAGARTFRNPILPGFHPDPSICRVGADYYLVTSFFEWFPGLPIHHSRDLVHWRPLGHVLDRPEQLPLDGIRPSGGLYAPTIRHLTGPERVLARRPERCRVGGGPAPLPGGGLLPPGRGRGRHRTRPCRHRGAGPPGHRPVRGQPAQPGPHPPPPRGRARRPDGDRRGGVVGGAARDPSVRRLPGQSRPGDLPGVGGLGGGLAGHRSRHRPGRARRNLSGPA